MSYRSDARMPFPRLSRYGTVSSCCSELHMHRGSWLLLLSLFPSASVLFPVRSVSSHSFEVAVREFPKEKRLLLVNCIWGIVNRSEQSRQRGTTRPATPPQGRYQLFPSHQTFWHLVTAFLPLPSVSTSSTLCLQVTIRLSFPQSCPFATWTDNIRGNNCQLGIRLCLNIPGLSQQCPCPSQVYVDRPVSS